jgi:hypothetical protein
MIGGVSDVWENSRVTLERGTRKKKTVRRKKRRTRRSRRSRRMSRRTRRTRRTRRSRRTRRTRRTRRSRRNVRKNLKGRADPSVFSDLEPFAPLSPLAPDDLPDGWGDDEWGGAGVEPLSPLAPDDLPGWGGPLVEPPAVGDKKRKRKRKRKRERERDPGDPGDPGDRGGLVVSDGLVVPLVTDEGGFDAGGGFYDPGFNPSDGGGFGAEGGFYDPGADPPPPPPPDAGAGGAEGAGRKKGSTGVRGDGKYSQGGRELTRSKYFTKIDDKKLEYLVKVNGHRWNDIAKQLPRIINIIAAENPGITEDSLIRDAAVICRQRYRQLGKNPDPWTVLEDGRLLEIMEEKRAEGVERPRWTEVAKKLATGRTGEQVSNRWKDHIDPKICHDPFTDEEDRKIIAHVGSRDRPSWAELERELSEDRERLNDKIYRRPANKIKNYWNINLSKRVKE